MATMAGLASSRVKDTTATKDMGNGESLQRQHEKPVAVVRCGKLGWLALVRVVVYSLPAIFANLNLL